MSQSVDQHLISLRRIVADLEQRLVQDAAWQTLKAFEADHAGASAAPSTEQIFERQRIEQRLSQNGDYRARQRLLEACAILTANAVSEPATVAPQVDEPRVVEPAAQESRLAKKPSNEPAQNLTRIRGINQELAARLEALSVRRYAQIADWNRDDCERISRELDLGRTISRQNWIEQAALLSVQSQADTVSPEVGATDDPEAVANHATPPNRADLKTTPAPAVTPPSPTPQSMPALTGAQQALAAELQPTSRSNDLLAKAIKQICRPVSEPVAEAVAEPVTQPPAAAESLNAFTERPDQDLLPLNGHIATNTNTDSADSLTPMFSVRQCEQTHRVTKECRARSIELPDGSLPFTAPTTAADTAPKRKNGNSADENAARDHRRPQSTPETEAHPMWSAGEQFPKDVIKPPLDRPMVESLEKAVAEDVDPALQDRVSDNTYKPPAEAFGNVLRRRPQNHEPASHQPPLMVQSVSPPAAATTSSPVAGSGSDVFAEVSVRQVEAVPDAPTVPPSEMPPPIRPQGISDPPNGPANQFPRRTANANGDQLGGGFGDGSQWRQRHGDSPDGRQIHEDLMTERLLSQHEEATVEIVRRETTRPLVPAHATPQTAAETGRLDSDAGKRASFGLTKRLFHAMTGRSS